MVILPLPALLPVVFISPVEMENVEPVTAPDRIVTLPLGLGAVEAVPVPVVPPVVMAPLVNDSEIVPVAGAAVLLKAMRCTLPPE